MKNKFTFLILILIGIIIVLGCGNLANVNTSTPPSNSTTVKTEPTQETTADKPTDKKIETTKEAETGGVTKANFDKIKTGMKYPEVVKILGKEGEVLSETSIGGSTTIMYKWDADEGDFGANMNAMFQNGKLMSKSQFGLK